MDYTDYDTRLAAYAVILDDAGRVLLALWNEAEQPEWTLPGGGVEWGETAEAGAVREVLEETGHDVQLGRLLGIDVDFVQVEDRMGGLDASGRAMRSVRVVFAASITGGELRAEVDGTTDEARWCPVAEVPGLTRVPLVDTALAMAGLG